MLATLLHESNRVSFRAARNNIANGTSLVSAKNFRPDIQGLRGVAVVAVVAYHLDFFFPGGFLGVDIFLVISGFVIGQILLNEWDRDGRVNWSGFFGRRFFRLIPVLAVVVTATVLISVLVLTSFSVHENVIVTGLTSILGFSNFAIAYLSGGYFGAAPALNPLLHTWSLGVEWQFYILFPLILFALFAISRWRKKTIDKPLFSVVVVVSVASFMASFGQHVSPDQGSIDFLGFYSPFPRLWEFGLGLIALLVVRSGAVLALPVSRGFFLLGLGMIGGSFFLVDENFVTPGWTTLFPTVGAAAVIITGAQLNGERGGVHGILAVRPLRWLGDLSYSLYLWHWPILFFAKEFGFPNNPQRMVAVVLLTLLLSLLTYQLVEKPFRSRNWPVRRRDVLRGTGIAALPLAVGALWLFVSDSYLAALERNGVIEVVAGDIGHDSFHEIVDERFFDCGPRHLREQADRWRGFIRCQQSDADQPPTVAIVGDSHAEHLFFGLAAALPEENLVYYTRSSELAVVNSSPEMAKILTTVEATGTIHTVIISNWWMLFGVPVGELAETVEMMESAEKRVIITNDVPTAPFPADECKQSALIFAERRCEFPISELEYSFEEIQRDLDRVALTSSSAQLIDTYQLFCQRGVCSMDRPGGGVLYRDSDHLNADGSLFVAEMLVKDARLERH